MKKYAFTLAEVLITLTIIGVIAVLTIPNLNKKWNDHADNVKLKEAYSILNNALKMAIREYGPIEEWDSGYQDKLAQYLKAKYKEGYMYDNQRSAKNLHGTKLVNSGGGDSYIARNFYELDNGTYFRVQYSGWYDNNSKKYFIIVVDINGKKSPNRYGYDVFQIDATNKGIRNINVNIGSSSNCTSYCNIKGTDNWYNGFACSTWALTKGNMDYKYRNVCSDNWPQYYK